VKFLIRPSIIKNTLIFCFLSLLYLSIVKSINEGVSALDYRLFLSFLIDYRLLIILGIFTAMTLYRGNKFSSYIFLIYTFIVLCLSFSFFLESFNKIVLLLNFCFSIISFNLFLFLKLDLKEPFYNPSFSKNMMPDFDLKILPVRLKQDGKLIDAFLTNWGEEGLFCRLKGEESKLKGEVEIEVTHNSLLFYAVGIITTRFHDGIGVRITKSPVPDLGWREYHNIIDELGLRPSAR